MISDMLTVLKKACFTHVSFFLFSTQRVYRFGRFINSSFTEINHGNAKVADVCFCDIKDMKLVIEYAGKLNFE